MKNDHEHSNKHKKISHHENARKQVLLVDIPYVSRPTSSFGKKLVNITKQVNPEFHLQPIPRPLPKVQTLFARKDPVPRELLSNVVYNVNCLDCSASYIGKTCRQVARRFVEHGREKFRSSPLLRLSQLVTSTSTTYQRPKRNVPCANCLYCFVFI
jgi:hypothetical protein